MLLRAGHKLKADIGVGKEAEDASLCILFNGKTCNDYVNDYDVYKRLI